MSLNRQALKNQSVLKLAAAHEPEVPTRLYKPLNLWRLQWMKSKLEVAKAVLKWDPASAARLSPANLPGNAVIASPQAQRLAALQRASSSSGVSVSFESRVLALAHKLRAQHGQQLEPGGGGSAPPGAATLLPRSGAASNGPR